MARNYYAILAISTPFKEVFNIASNLILKKRTQISNKNMRYMLCLRSQGIFDLNNNKDKIIISKDNSKIV